MTECEICGTEIKGHARYIQIGNSKLMVCEACARYGTPVMEPGEGGSGSRMALPLPLSLLRKKESRQIKVDMDRVIEEELALGEDYGRKVKEAREKAGLRQDELARMINEKQSLLRKIENEAMIPTREVQMKIERVLKPYLELNSAEHD